MTAAGSSRAMFSSLQCGAPDVPGSRGHLDFELTTASTDDRDAAILKRLRAEFERDRAEMLGFQKAAPDRDFARFFKERAGELLKLQRAVNLFLDHILGTKSWRPVSEWPAELLPDCHTVDAMVRRERWPMSAGA